MFESRFRRKAIACDPWTARLTVRASEVVRIRSVGGRRQLACETFERGPYVCERRRRARRRLEEPAVGCQFGEPHP